MELLRTIYVEKNETMRQYQRLITLRRDIDQVNKKSNKGRLYSKYKKAFWLGVIIPVIQQLTGVNAIYIFAASIFEGQSNEDYVKIIIPVSIAAFSLLTIPIVTKFNRRTLFLTGSALCSLGHLICFLSLYETGTDNLRNWIFNIGLIIYVGTFNSTYGATTYSCYYS
jgi:hypothetical protein